MRATGRSSRGTRQRLACLPGEAIQSEVPCECDKRTSLVRQTCPLRAFCWVVLPVRQPCPLRATMLMHITIAAQLTTLPLVRLYGTVFSLQPCHLPDFMPLFSVYSRATCQTLCHCFQFTAVPLARLYATVFSLQPCHLPDFISLVPVYSRATGQTLFHWFQFTAVPLARLYFIGFSLHWSDFISLASVLTLVKLYFIVSACSPAACQTLLHWFQFTARPLTRLLHYYQFTTPPPVRLYCTSFSLQPGQLPHFIALVSVYSPATYQTIALLSVYNAATCQTLLHWFQFTAVPIATLYCIGFSLQSCHLSDFIPLVPVNNHTTGQTYSIGLSWQSRRLSDFNS